jgi:hypothetical protein
MKKLAVFCGVLALLGAGIARAEGLQGDYIEARTADVFTGPCFSNAEVFITGHQAILAWKVNQGSWEGVDLAGLTVAAAVRGTTTFSEDDPAGARAVIVVDERATPRQREALVSLARHLGGDRLQNVVAVRSTTMDLTVESHEMKDGQLDRTLHHGMPNAPKASFWAAGLAHILTRPLDENDHFCGNEVVAYRPLSQGVDVLPAYTLGNSFKGEGLGTTWSDPNARSSFVGHFAY